MWRLKKHCVVVNEDDGAVVLHICFETYDIAFAVY